MIKCIILNGIPSVMDAFVSLAKEEKPDDQDFTFTRKDWKADEANHKRGLSVLETLYRDDNAKIWASFGAHEDIRWFFLSQTSSILGLLVTQRGYQRTYLTACS